MFVIFLFLILPIGHTLGDVHWNCRRPKQDCEGAGAECDFAFGNCTCPNNLQGFKCQVQGDDSIFGKSTCVKNCQNGGRCYIKIDGSQACDCTADYIGDKCENNRVEVKCDGENFSINFTPILPFIGQLFIGDDENKDTCKLSKENNTDIIKGVFPLDQSCDGYVEKDDASNDTIYKKELNIRYSTRFTQGADLVFNVSCIHSANKTSESAGEIGAAIQDHGGVIVGEEITSEYKPAILAVRDYPNYLQDLSDDVTLGEKVYLFNYLYDDSIYQYIYVKSCTVTDDGDKSINILENGCPIEKVFFESANTTTRPPGVTHGMRIFKLSATTRMLKFVCVVSMCKEADKADCALKDCDNVANNAGSNSGRRKRSLDKSGPVNEDLAENEQRVVARVIIRDSLPNLDSSEDEVNNADKVCSDQAVTMATVIILIVLTCVLLLVTSVLTACLVRSFRSVKTGMNEDKQGFDNHGFQIPRIKAMY